MFLFWFFLFGALAEVHASALHLVSLLRLYEDYESEPPASVRTAMQEELDSIMAPIGWQIDWTRLKRSSVGELSVSLAVIHFRGVCDVAEPAVGAETGQVLGSTEVGEGNVLPFSDVDCGAVSAFVAWELTGFNARQRRKMLGRALGRVLAHELYHVLAQEQRHGSTGIAKANLSPTELCARNFRFGSREVQKLRIRLVPAVMSFKDPPALERSSFSVFVGSGCSGCHGLRGEGTRWGPSLCASGKTYDAAKLKTRLTSTDTEMYKRAKNLNVLWPRFKDTEVELLSDYLKELVK